MAVAIKKINNDANVAPHWHAHAKEIQKYGSVIEDMPHPLSARVRADMVAKLLKIDTPVVQKMHRAIFAEQLTPAMIQPVIEAGLKYGAITKPMRAEELIAREAATG